MKTISEFLGLWALLFILWMCVVYTLENVIARAVKRGISDSMPWHLGNDPKSCAECKQIKG